jgi:hypothetical protein
MSNPRENIKTIGIDMRRFNYFTLSDPNWNYGIYRRNVKFIHKIAILQNRKKEDLSFKIISTWKKK